ncbi:MAG: precorrin-6A reductase [Methanomethylophilus sp.]|jgi:precorrin-6Y C5,15-methyltransferase (decarboxylating)
MAKALVFAGTTEGGEIAEVLAAAGVKVHACVATEYGRTSVEAGENVEVSSHPLSDDEMLALMKEYPVVVDATHPYAVRISAHVKEACERLGAQYIRLVRPESLDRGDVVEVDSVKEAAEFLKDKEGNILATTGSKELAEYTVIPNYKERVFARVLSLHNVAAECAKLGFEGKNLFMMQGPFCEELDYGMLLQTNARWLVTKDSGVPGGFAEKVAAARRAGAKIVLVGRPPEQPGQGFRETVEKLEGILGVKLPMPKRRLAVVGIGVGPGTGLTAAASEAVRSADLVAGAERMLDIPEAEGKAKLKEYTSEKIFAYLAEHPEFRRPAVLVSGDVGFYSAARQMLEKADPKEWDTEVHCGISSVQYMCARAGIPWQDVNLVSAHGREADVAGEVRTHNVSFIILNGAEGVKQACRQLIDYGLGDVAVDVGCDLGYPAEKFVSGSPQEILSADLGYLCCALVFNPHPDTRIPLGIPDSEFGRGDAPMTKSEVRDLSVAKLRLSPDSVVYDVGAGTGSVTVEMALAAYRGKVYAVEKEEEAASLIDANRKKFGAANVEIVKGTAPEALRDLPAPTHAFVGGSSGNLKEIVQCILGKNPSCRIVVNSVTLETISEVLALPSALPVEQEEIVCVNVAYARHLGHYNLMNAQNPVYIAVLRGKPDA